MIKNNKIVLATSNAGKIKEMDQLLQLAGFSVVAQSALGVKDAKETGTTFIENAIIKARHAAEKTGLPAIADDSGLTVDYLNGAPGLYSARYAGEGKNDNDNIQKLLDNIKDVPDEQRHARFHCVLVYIRHANDPIPIVCHGVFNGLIAHQRSGINGFGYDPIFFIPDYQCTAADLNIEIKKQISHRGQALKQLFDQLCNEKISTNS